MNEYVEWLEREIYNVYQKFHRERPQVKPKEAGYLGQLWTEYDALVSADDR